MTLVIVNDYNDVVADKVLTSVNSVISSFGSILNELEVITRSPTDSVETEKLVNLLESVDTRFEFKYQLIMDPLLVSKVHTNTGNDNTREWTTNQKIKVSNNTIRSLLTVISSRVTLFLNEGDEVLTRYLANTSLLRLLNQDGISKLAISNTFDVFNDEEPEVFIDDQIDLSGLLINTDLINNFLKITKDYFTNPTSDQVRLILESLGYLAKARSSLGTPTFSWFNTTRNNLVVHKSNKIYEVLNIISSYIRPKYRTYNIARLVSRALSKDD